MGPKKGMGGDKVEPKISLKIRTIVANTPPGGPQIHSKLSSSQLSEERN